VADNDDRADIQGVDQLAKVVCIALQIIRSARAARRAASTQIHGHASRAGAQAGDDVVPNGVIGLPTVNEQEPSIARPLFDVIYLGAVTRLKASFDCAQDDTR
jgi:hypothetical protein